MADKDTDGDWHGVAVKYRRVGPGQSSVELQPIDGQYGFTVVSIDGGTVLIGVCNMIAPDQQGLGFHCDPAAVRVLAARLLQFAEAAEANAAIGAAQGEG